MQALTFERIPLVHPDKIHENSGVLIPLFNVVLGVGQISPDRASTYTKALGKFTELWRQQPNAKEAAYFANLAAATQVYAPKRFTSESVAFDKNVKELLSVLQLYECDLRLSIRQIGIESSTKQCYLICVEPAPNAGQILRIRFNVDDYNESRALLLHLVTVLQHYALLSIDPGSVLRVQAALGD